MTAILSEICWTTERSCAINRNAAPVIFCTSSKRLIICGFGEILKHALISNTKNFKFININKKNILVVGIFVVDLSFKAKKLPSPGETIIGENYIIGPGGKGSNQAVAISRAGGKVSLIARIGDDHFANIGLNLYQKENFHIFVQKWNSIRPVCEKSFLSSYLKINGPLNPNIHYLN